MASPAHLLRPLLLLTLLTGTSALLNITEQQLVEVIFLPLLSGAKLIQRPSIPQLKLDGINALKLAQEVFKDILPCLAPCLLAQGERLLNSILYQNDSYGQCIKEVSMQLADVNFNISDPDTQNTIENKTIWCPIINTGLNCILQEVTAQCGPGMADLVRRLVPALQRLLGCVDNSTVQTYDIFQCIMSDNERDFSADIALYKTLRESPTYTRVVNGSWRDAYQEESTNNSSLLCGFLDDLESSFSNYDGHCGDFLDSSVQDNLNITRQYLNCGVSGSSEILNCFGNPILYENCLSTFMSQVPTMLLTMDACGPFAELVNCTKQASGMAGCGSLELGLDHILAPLLDAVCGGNTTGLSDQEKSSINTCRCLDGFSSKVPLLGNCNDTFDPPTLPTTPPAIVTGFPPTPPAIVTGLPTADDFLVNLTVLQLWETSFAGFTDCEHANAFSVVCQRVQLGIGNDLGIDFVFLGLAPTSTDLSAVFFLVTLDTVSRYNAVSSALRRLVSTGTLGVVPVSRNVTITLHSDLAMTARPLSGPQAGGTPLTITGLIGSQPVVTINNQICTLNMSTNVLLICLTPGLVDSRLLGRGMDISIQHGLQANRSIPRPTGFMFTYLPNPIITSFEPRRSHRSGGVLVTVSGENMNVATVRMMITTFTGRGTGITDVYRTTCFGDSPLRMFCPTAPFNVERFRTRRRRSPEGAAASSRSRRAPGSLNDEAGVDADVCVMMDRVEMCTEGPTNDIDYFDNPTFDRFDPLTRTFTPIAPVRDRTIEIRGMQLLPEANYLVKIGVANCTNIDISSNLIICEPPQRRPEVSSEDNVGLNQIPVLVLYNGATFSIGFLRYIQTTWEHPPSRYGIVGGLSGFLLLVLIAIVCVCKKLSRMNRTRGGMNGGQNLVEGGAMKNPRRFVSFIPAGIRRNPKQGLGVDQGGAVFSARPQTHWVARPL